MMVAIIASIIVIIILVITINNNDNNNFNDNINGNNIYENTDKKRSGVRNTHSKIDRISYTQTKSIQPHYIITKIKILPLIF